MRLLVVSQVYVPDPASVGQHMADAAEDMAARRWSVRVLTSDRGYDNPEDRLQRRELRNGVQIVRLPFTSFGKGTLVRRLVGQLSFCLQAIARALLGPKLDLILITTAPIMSSTVGLVLGWLRRVPVAFWVMDINPDQAVAAGKVGARGLLVRALDFTNRRMLRQARVVVALDRFMASTLKRKAADASARIHVVPPWSHESHLQRIEHQDNPFRRRHHLDGKFVVMYSGNHSLVHPLTTLLEAARVLSDDPSIVFFFIGGGEGKKEVDLFSREHALPNVTLLPYQPLNQIRYSLSAADLHVISMGQKMVGIIHPCKFYGAMALAKPVLCFGPEASHVGEIIRDTGCGWRIDHGDVEATVRLLRSLADWPPAELQAIGQKGRMAVDSFLSERLLRSRFSDLMESVCRVDAQQ